MTTDFSTPHLPSPTLHTMPNICPGWTPQQSIHLRIAAIEYLRVGHQGEEGAEYLNMFFQEWLMVHEMPSLDNESNIEAVLVSYKAVSTKWALSSSSKSQHLIFCSTQRVITTIKWHAFAGSNKLQGSAKTRIRTLNSSLKRDLFLLWDLPEDQPKMVSLKEYVFVPNLGVEAKFSKMKL